jgi:hypothetical protein
MLIFKNNSVVDIGYCEKCPNHGGKVTTKNENTLISELFCEKCSTELTNHINLKESL